MERIKAARGTTLRCQGWRQEAILRMLENNLENAEKPDELIIYGGTGKAARNWDAFRRIVETLKSLRDDETLVVQSGKPVAGFRIQRRVANGYCDRIVYELDEALETVLDAKASGRALSIGLVGNCAEVHPELVQRRVRPDIVTDQTSAHDPLGGYIPRGLTVRQATELRADHPDEYLRRSRESIAIHVRAMLDFLRNGSVVFDYGNNIRGQAKEAGVQDAFAFQGFVPLFIRPLFAEGRGPFRWVAVTGNPEDILKTDSVVLREFPNDETLSRWIHLAEKHVPWEGLPARVCWLGYGGRRVRRGRAMRGGARNSHAVSRVTRWNRRSTPPSRWMGSSSAAASLWRSVARTNRSAACRPFPAGSSSSASGPRTRWSAKCGRRRAS